MEKRTIGAWLINHTNKLHEIKDSYEFEDIELAGKCGIFLANLSASDEQSDLSAERVLATAKVSNIKKTEIETIKNKLKEARLIDTSSSGSISVLGITTSSVLSHTANIFENDQPNNFQKAALELSDNISDLPKGESILKEYISDTFKLDANQTHNLFLQAEEIGFIDYEALGENDKFYFNGNLFRRENLQKTSAVLSTLKNEEVQRIQRLDELLTKNGCVTKEDGENLLGNVLLSKFGYVSGVAL